jgi:hypothetical protein
MAMAGSDMRVRLAAELRRFEYQVTDILANIHGERLAALREEFMSRGGVLTQVR